MERLARDMIENIPAGGGRRRRRPHHECGDVRTTAPLFNFVALLKALGSIVNVSFIRPPICTPFTTEQMKQVLGRDSLEFAFFRLFWISKLARCGFMSCIFEPDRWDEILRID